MEKIINILLFLPSVITGLKISSTEDYSPDLRYDITKPWIHSLSEMLQHASLRALRNHYAERISELQPNVPHTEIDSKNITFSKFLTDEEIIFFLDLKYIVCFFNLNLQAGYMSDSKRKKMNVQGNVEFVNSANTTPASQPLEFNITFNRLYLEIEINYIKLKTEKKMNITEQFTKIQPWRNGNIISCNSNKNISMPICGDIVRAIQNGIKNRIQLITKSAFQFIADKCLNFVDEFHEDTAMDYLSFKLDHNITTFPWMHDYKDVVMAGVNHIFSLDITHYDGFIFPNYTIHVRNIIIRWNVTSFDSKEYNIAASKFYMGGMIHDDFSMSDLRVNFFIHSIQENNGHIALSDETIAQIEAKIAQLIKETARKIPYNYIDADARVPESLAKILQQFDEKTFETLLFKPENTTKVDCASGTVYFSEIQANGFSDLKTITCYLQPHSEIGEVIYEQLNAQVNFTYEVNEARIYKVSITGNVYIENASIAVFLNRYPNSTEGIGIHITDTFNDSKTTITIDPGNYRLRQTERIFIGKQIFETFVEMVKTRVINIVKSMLDPIFEVCESTPGKIAESVSNRHNPQKKFFASIRDRWANATIPIDAVINGSWNYQSINLQRANKVIVVDGLRVENVTVNVKQFADNAEQAVLSSYNITFISITINHTGKDVRVNIPNFAGDRVLLENLELTIASFTEQLIYNNDLSYQKKYQKLAVEAMDKAIREYNSSEYDKSTIITKNFVNKLLKCHHFENNQIHKSFTLRISLFFKSPFMIDILDVTFGDTFIREEIYDYYNHSLMQINLKQISMEVIGSCSTRAGPQYPYIKTNNSIEISRIDFSYNHSDGALRIKLDDRNIRVQLFPETEMNETAQETMKKRITQFVSSTLKQQNQTWFSTQLPWPTELPTTIVEENEYDLPNPPEKHYYSIDNAIQYTSRRFLKYHVQIRGLLNFRKVRLQVTRTDSKFEFAVANLTARIFWTYYMGGLIPKIPLVKQIDLQIDEILLVGKITQTSGELIFTDSQLNLVNQRNSLMSKLKDKFEPIVIKSIQQSIQVEYDDLQKRHFLTFD